MTEPKLGDKWIIEDMTIILTPEQLLKAALSVAGIRLGQAEVYVQDIRGDEDGNWVLKIKGAE